MNRLKKLVNLFKNPKILRVLAIVIIIAAIFGALFYFEKTAGRISIDTSQVEATIIPITPQTPGPLKKIYVQEGDSIKKGDPLLDVGDDTIRSQTDGLVIQTYNAVGSIVSAQTPVVQLVDPSQMRVVGTIDENKGLNKLKVGQIVSFSVDAYPGQTFWGYLDEISQTAKQTQLSFSISNQRPTQQFEVFARFNALSYPQIKNGMSAKMVIYTKNP